MWGGKHVNKIIVLLFFANSVISANVGGRFFEVGTIGLQPFVLGSVLETDTKIDCNDSLCNFTTVYKTNAPNKLFVGRFFGSGVSDVYVNEVPSQLLDFSTTEDSIKIPRLVEKTNVFDVNVQVGADSVFSISGKTAIGEAKYWGFAEYREMTKFRHMLFQNQKRTSNSGQIQYLFAPTQKFPGYNKARIILNYQGSKYQFAGRNQNGRDKERFDGRYSDTTVYLGTIPPSYSVYFEKEKNSTQLDYIGLGGPRLCVGRRNGRYTGELMWEVSVDPVEGVGILPMVGVRATKGLENQLIYGVSVVFMQFGLSVVKPQNGALEFGGQIGLYFGLEARSKGAFFYIGI